MERNIYKIGKELFITSNKEIKEGDWCVDDIDEVFKIEGLEYFKQFCKKIILTTDQDLIKDGVQAIDNEFLEWFVKNPSCEKVDFWKYMSGEYSTMTKEEPKTAWVGVLHDKLNEYYPAKYELKDIYQGEGCLPNFPNEELCQIWCDSKYKEEPKQETLEESNQTTAIRFLEWYRLKKVIFQFHCYHIPNVSDRNWETTVFLGDNSYLNANQLFEIFKKENYE